MRRLFTFMAAAGIASGMALSAMAEDAYIDSDGTQAVVLDYYVKPTTKIVADYAFLSVTPVQSRVFGASSAYAGLSCAHYINGSGNYAFAFRDGDGDWLNMAITATTDRRTFEIDGPSKKARLYTDGELTKEMNTASPTATSVYPLALFATTKNEAGTILENPGSKVRLYSLEIYESGTQVMDLRPVLKNGVYLLKDAVTGKVYGPTVGNPLTGGGDIATETDTIEWTGAQSADWNVAGNWQIGGAVSAQPPQTGDDVVIPAGASVDISGVAATVKCLTLSGGGTVALTGRMSKTLADSLAIESGTTLSLASGTTVHVPAATAGGAALAAGSYVGGSQSWLAGSGALFVDYAGSSVADGVLTFDVPAGKTVEYYTQLTASITKIVKLGAGTAVISNDNNTAFSGTVEVREGILEAQSGQWGRIDTFGGKKANTITVTKGAQLRVLAPNSTNQGAERFPNHLFMAGEGPDGRGALYFVKTAQAKSGSSANIDCLFSTVTLTGDATASGTARMGFSNGTLNLGGHVFSHRPAIAGGSSMFMWTSTTVSNGCIVAKNSSDVITQGSPSFKGSAANTFTVESGSMFDMWNTSFGKFDWTLILKGGSWLRAGSGNSETVNKLLGPIVLNNGSVTVTNYSSSGSSVRINLAGPISGAGKMFHNGNNLDTYLMNGNNTWTGGLEAKGGTVWGTTTGSIPPRSIRASGSGKVNFVAKNWDLGTLHNTLTNWDGNGAVNVYTASGETFTDDVDFEYPASYRHGGPGTLTFTANTTPEGNTKLINGEGAMTVAGNKVRRLSKLDVSGGTLTLENAGYIWAGTWDVANNAHKANVTWTVGGANNTTPAKMVVKSGTVIDTFVPGAAASSSFNVEDSGTKGAILEVHDGAAITNKLNIGFSEKRMGAFYQYGGSVRTICYGSNDGFTARYANSYGFVDLMGGTLAMRNWWRFGGHPTSVGVLRISGGTFTADSALCVSFGGWGELYMTGGQFRSGGVIHIGELHWGDKTAGNYDTRRGLLTLGGAGNPQMNVASWFDVCERTNQFMGVVNMNAGVLATPTFAKSDYEMNNRDNDTAKAFVNFGGGAWKAYDSSSAIFSSGVRKVDRVTVFPGGATLDINGKTSSNAAVPFEKPFGKGVASITWPSGTSTNGYLGAPEVYITGGGGTGAVAHCTFDARTGTLGEIVVSSPGWGYTSAPTATIKSADRKTTITCAVTMTDGEEQPGGGLTLTNSSATAGTFTLSSANTYTGATVVAGGTLKLGAADAIPAANEVRLAGGTFDAASYNVSYARVGGYGTLKGNVTVTDKLVFDAAQPTTPGLAVNGTLNVANGVTVEIANTNLLTRGTIHTLATSSTPFPATLQSNLQMPWRVYLSDGGKTLKMGYLAGTMMLLK